MAGLGKLQQRAAFVLHQIDWQAQLGLVMLLASCLLGLDLILQWQQQQDLLAKLAQPQVKSQPQRAQSHPQNTVQQFYQLLPKASQADAMSASILHTADGLGLRFERAEFSTAQLPNLVQHQIKLPVRGSYMQIRQFLNALLNAHPTLALMELQVRREDVFSDSVQANMVLTLYLRGEVPW